jgi:ribose transport system substrate-binding protein
MKIARVLLVSCLLLLVGVTGGCSKAGTGTPSGAAKPPAKLKIGFSQATMQSPFYVELKEGAAAAAKKAGYELIFLDANLDVAKQNNDIQDLITQGVDVLILNPVNPEAVVPSIKAAKDAGIPVITVDRPVTSGAVAHVGRDNVEMGRLVGQAVADKLGASGGKIIEIQGDAGGIVMANRRDGFHNALKGASGVKIVKGPYAEYIRANAVTAMQDLLQANPDVKVVYSHNDDMSLGALQVLTEAQKTKVLVCGVDGLMEALKAIKNGDQYMATALNDPRYLGDVTIQVAQRVKAGQTVPKFIDAGTVLVTKANVDTYLGSTLFGVYRPAIKW